VIRQALARLTHPYDAGVVQGTAAPHAPCSRATGNWVLVGTILGSSMVFIDSTVVNIALPVIQGELHADAFNIQWVANAYTLFLASLILVGGSLGDNFGRRRVFMIGTVVFAVASIGCGLSQNISQLIAARAVQGIGSALLTPGSLAIISATFSKEQRGRAIGMWSAATAITAALGPVLGGWIVQYASWRWIFFINIPLAIAALAIAAAGIPESRDDEPVHLDFAGALLGTLALGALTYGLIEAGTLGWTSWLVIVSLAIGVVALVAFVRVEEHAPSPMMPLSVFASRTFSATNLLTLLLYGALGGVLYFLPFDLIQVQHYSPVAAGFALLPFIAIVSLLSPWSGTLVARYGPRIPLIIGPTLAAFGIALLAMPSIGGSYWTTFFPAIVVLGLGMAVTVAPLTTTVLESVDERHVGLASGINNAASRAAGLLAVAVLSLLVVGVFGMSLQHQLSAMGAPSPIVTAMMAQRDRLAEAQPPPSAPPAMRAELRNAVTKSYLSAFRAAALVSALMAFGSAIITVVMIAPSTNGRKRAGAAQATSQA
jgi:EmrB/QacA subfamily drug resistance transporter